MAEFEEKTKKLREYLVSYSFNDLARSFFVLNLWLPNISSPIKTQYLYVILEAISAELPSKNLINEYSDFKDFIEKLLPIIPSFPIMEDYFPENDWGEIKYFLSEKFYKMFYGGDLSNPYDFCYSFETIHGGFNEYYLEKIGRSPINEFEFCLSIQDEIINQIDISTQDKREVDLGYFGLPSETFWKTASSFLDNFESNLDFSPDLIKEYTKNLDVDVPRKLPSEEEFLTFAHDGKNCFYFFIKKSNSIFPVLPRKYFSVLFDKWGRILTDQYPTIIREVKHHEIKVGVELYHFIKQRVQERELFFISSAIQPDLKPHKTIFTTSFISKNRLVVIHVLPPVPTPSQQKILESLSAELNEAQSLLSQAPVRLGLHGESRMVQFESTKGTIDSPKPLIITVIPHITTDFGAIYPPDELVGEVMGLEQLLGIFDEIEDLDEIADFFDYIESLRESSTFSPVVSILDHFGSFKDSSGILIPGAENPDMIILDPQWGTNFRYHSLAEFWKFFPRENFFGHPRSWFIEEETKKDNVLVLRSRNFFGYVYCCSLGKTFFFVNCPAHALSFQQGKITDSLMGSLADGMALYKKLIQELLFVKTGQKLHALFSPLSLIEKDQDFAHLSHLKPKDENGWIMDITRLRGNNFGIRIVFDEEKIIKLLKDAKDRSLQIELLLGILRKINTIFKDPNFEQIELKLQQEKSKRNRFRIYTLFGHVSFPEIVSCIEPGARDFKLADKKIAELGKVNGIIPGEYGGQEAKGKIDLIKNALISYVNDIVKDFKFEAVLPILIKNIDALTEHYERKKSQIKNSLDQDIDYERDVNLSEDKQTFLDDHANNKYLLEKFVQMQSAGTKELSASEHSELLALVDRLLTLYNVSDFLHYGIYSAKVKIRSDFRVDIIHGVDINKMQADWAREQARINLGVIGNQSDDLSSPIKIETYLNELDDAFKKDLGFSLKDMVNVQQVLSCWSIYNNTTERTSYNARMDEIRDICTKNINGFNSETTQKILDFLTLDPGKILLIEDNPTASDIPVWEYRKRVTRYSIKPLIKIGKQYYWGAHSTDRSGKIWTSITNVNKLPADIKIQETSCVLEKGHRAEEKALQEKIIEIVSRFTKKISSNVYPHKLGISTSDIGDIDICSFLEKENIILNIESKIIDQAFCIKDLKRISEKVFGRIKSDGTFEEGYLQSVEKRAKLLNEKGEEIIYKCWQLKQKGPKVVSIFLTSTSYWWTKYPPIKNDINFIELRMLDDFIKSLTDKA